MGDNLFYKPKSERENLKSQKGISYCAVCNTRLPPKSIFCPECDPPLPPGEEPEETGISFGQALLRIGVLVILFTNMENFEIGNIETLNSRKKHGVYFTPYFIAKYITRETINFSSNFRTLDPACGTGVFLSAAAHLMDKSGIKHEEIIDNLFGFDINSEAIIISKIIIGMELGLDNKLFKRFIIKTIYIV